MTVFISSAVVFRMIICRTRKQITAVQHVLGTQIFKMHPGVFQLKRYLNLCHDGCPISVCVTRYSQKSEYSNFPYIRWLCGLSSKLWLGCSDNCLRRRHDSDADFIWRSKWLLWKTINTGRLGLTILDALDVQRSVFSLMQEKRDGNRDWTSLVAPKKLEKDKVDL